MAKRKERFPLVKVTIKLFEGDFREIGDLYPKTGANKIIREIIHRHIAVCKEKAQQSLAALEDIPIDIEISDEEVAHAGDV